MSKQLDPQLDPHVKALENTLTAISGVRLIAKTSSAGSVRLHLVIDQTAAGEALGNPVEIELWLAEFLRTAQVCRLTVAGPMWLVNWPLVYPEVTTYLLTTWLARCQQGLRLSPRHFCVPALDWNAILEAAYQELQRAKIPVDSLTLLRNAEQGYLRWRNRCIESWAQEIQQRVPAARLLTLADPIRDLVYDQGWFWESPSDDAEAIAFAAHGLATLRWVHRNRRNRLPLSITYEAVVTWLITRQPPQLTPGRLF